MKTRIFCLFLLAALTLGACVCKENHYSKGVAMNEPRNDAISLTLTADGEQHVLHEAQLEELRLLAVIRLMQEGGDYPAFGEELQRAELWQMAGSVRFGSWIFEQRDGQLTLVRNPPRGPVMRMILVAFAVEDGQWSVRAVSEQRVMAR